jgi:hypothetical protein
LVLDASVPLYLAGELSRSKARERAPSANTGRPNERTRGLLGRRRVRLR